MKSSLTRRQFIEDGSKLAVGTSLLGSLLAACGSTGGPTPNTPSTVNLNFWVLGYQAKGANQTGKLMDAAVAAYHKGHSNVNVNITGYTGDEAGFTKLTKAVEGGGAVDFFRLPSDVLALLVKEHQVAAIDDYLTADDKADIFPNLLDTVAGPDQKHYAWPLWVPPVGMYLNLDIFKERNVEVPPDDWTYDQFVEIAKKLTFTRSNGQKVYGYTGVVDAGVVNTWPIILGDGALPLSQDNKKYTFNTPEGISGLQKLMDLAQKHKVTPPDFGTQTTTDMTNGFLQTKTYAMYSEPSGASAGYKAKNLNFTVKPMPIGATGKHVTAGGIGLIAVANIDDKDKLKASMDIVRYLTGSQVQKDVTGFYLAPGARKSVTVNDPISLFTPFVPYCYITPIIPQWPQIRTILHSYLQKAVLGKLSASDALNGPANEINGILGGS